MNDAPSTPSRAASVGLLRALLAALAVVLVWRYVDFTEGPDWSKSPLIAFWLLRPILTLIPLVHAFKHAGARPFYAALVFAAFAQLEILAYVSPSDHSAFFERTATREDLALSYVLRLAGVILLWQAALWFSHLEGPETRVRRRNDWRIPLAIVLIYVVLGAVQLQQSLRLEAWGFPSPWTYIGIELVVVLVAMVVLRTTGTGHRRMSAHLSQSLMLGVFVGVLSAGLSASFHWWSRGEWFGDSLFTFLWPGMEWLVLMVVAAPVLEEWAYRGVLWNACRRRFGSIACLMLTATLFGLIHGAVIVRPIAMPTQFLMGIAFGWIRLVTGRLSASIVAHATTNAVIFLF